VDLLRQRGKAIRNFDFVLDGRPDQAPGRARRGAVWLSLDDEALARKLQAATSYRELAFEVDRALRGFGPEAFRTECLRPVDAWESVTGPQRPVFYEAYGASKVLAGHYLQVLRYREHMAPLIQALRRYARKGKACTH
jgi:hypothetical protein